MERTSIPSQRINDFILCPRKVADHEVECCSMLSIAYLSASSSECSTVSCLIKFGVPINWIFPMLSFQTHPIPLNLFVEVHEPSTMQILPKLKACILQQFVHVEVKQNVAIALTLILLAALPSVLGYLPLWLTVMIMFCFSKAFLKQFLLTYSVLYITGAVT
ncbi:hypothetical protein DY000_02057151 [Brassica cretica]|uniref:Uncharacterized protein n=1 Tax=Brassica cretica TaxID=69181 RepID=A0ABQ7AE06_BRACR|nr:hypothetical protein DY000_02057151 [Brassica cretica]